jgi:hypothetical protein
MEITANKEIKMKAGDVSRKKQPTEIGRTN